MDVGHDVLLVPAQYPTIGDAVRALRRPSTIMVSPGVYAEDVVLVDVPDVVISTTHFGRRGVVLVGDVADSVVRAENSSVYLSGIEIRSNGRARAISATRTKMALQECVLAGNRVRGDDDLLEGAGMWCVDSAVRIQKSMLIGNSIEAPKGEARGGALHCTDCKVEIAGCTLQANTLHAGAGAKGAGVYLARSRLRLWRSRVTDNALFAASGEGAGVYCEDSAAQLGGSVITGNSAHSGVGAGLYVRGATGEVAVHGNTVVRQNYPDDQLFQQ